MRLQVGAILDGAELCQAAFAGNLSYVQMLLQFGANPDAADYDRRTAAHLGCAQGHADLCVMLAQFGADLRFQDRWGGTPLEEAQRNGHGKLAEALLQLGEVRLQHGLGAPGATARSTAHVPAIPAHVFTSTSVPPDEARGAATLRRAGGVDSLLPEQQQPRPARREVKAMQPEDSSKPLHDPDAPTVGSIVRQALRAAAEDQEAERMSGVAVSDDGAGFSEGGLAPAAAPSLSMTDFLALLPALSDTLLPPDAAPSPAPSSWALLSAEAAAQLQADLSEDAEELQQLREVAAKRGQSLALWAGAGKNAAAGGVRAVKQKDSYRDGPGDAAAAAALALAAERSAAGSRLGSIEGVVRTTFVNPR